MDSVNVNTKSVKVNGLILAIDLGKYKSVVCAYESVEPSWQVASFTTNRQELVKVLEKYRPGVVVIEACALCGWVRDLSSSAAYPARSPTYRARPGSSSTLSERRQGRRSAAGAARGPLVRRTPAEAFGY
jgi:hypothetical protein